MTSKKYTYNSKATNGHERVNVWKLNKTVKAQAQQIQILQRHVAHQVGLNTQQVLLNESLHDRVAELEQARWRTPVKRWFKNAKHWFKKWVGFVSGK